MTDKGGASTQADSALPHCAGGDAHQLFEAVGGFPELPLLEDVALLRALRRRTRVRTLPAALVTSGRRYRRDGVVRTWLKHTGIIFLYLAGVSPRRLARWRDA